MKTDYLKMLEDKKYTIEYYRLHYYKNIRICRYMKYLLAIIGTGSLAGLCFLPKWETVMVGIIAFAQIFQAIEPHMPYQKRSHDLGKQIFAMESIFIDIEHRWRGEVRKGLLDDLEINELIKEFEIRWNNSRNRNLEGDDIPVNNKYSRIAGSIARKYMTDNYI